MSANPYVPDLKHPEPFNAGTGQLLQGTGAPSASLGNNGDVYINITNGNIYSKAGDIWILSTVGSGGTVQVIAGSVADPNAGTIIPDDHSKGAIYYQKGAYSLWNWDTQGQAWVAINA